ncbi:beta tubulin [Stylonychia lemnae]|uniref:Beta tubulin n=1 Tax=Stylonychia lemnae TaxID=5949 RepID=A0A078BEC0_STYLE|nr:beta tubulin [Stylonychia lemnae]|eukprot:CDW91873.1 beta tubulin [Stylonychia lemnae]
MKEIINIGIGNYGIQLVNEFLEELCLDHDIGLDGVKKVASEKDQQLDYPNIYFEELSCGRFLSRSLMIDTDCTKIENIRCGKTRYLQSIDNYLCLKQGGAGNYAKARNAYEDGLKDSFKDKLRKLVEGCDKFQAFQLQYATGGGTGSGLGNIQSTFKRKIIRKKSGNIQYSPLHQLTNRMCKLNCIFRQSYPIRSLLKKSSNIPKPNIEDLNYLMTQYMATMISTLRFPSQQINDFRKIGTSTIPFPRMHFLTPSMANLAPRFIEEYEKDDMITKDVCFRLFDSRNTLLDIDYSQGRFYSYTAIFRGLNYSSVDLFQVLQQIRNLIAAILRNGCLIIILLALSLEIQSIYLKIKAFYWEIKQLFLKYFRNQEQISPIQLDEKHINIILLNKEWMRWNLQKQKVI